jgi:tRNA modification GTPase
MRVMPFSSSEPGSVQPVRAALLTPPGRGALAVVGVTGPGAAELVDRLFVPRAAAPLGGRPDGAIAFGAWRSTGEDVVVVRRAADRVEIHGHGGTAAPAAVLAGLLAAGAEPGRWQEWVDEGPCRREAVEALPAAVASKAAMILSRQASGLMDRAIERLDGLQARGGHDTARGMAARLLAASRVGLRLTEPWRVLLAGEVNAGKSSLMNAILGHGRSIVSPVPGTTRDLVVATTVLGGWAVDLIDTAGTRREGEPGSAAEREGIARAAAAARDADLVVRVLPADVIPDPVPRAGAAELVVVSKADLPLRSIPTGAILTSAVTGMGVEALVGAIVERLVPEEAADPELLAGPVPFTRRQVELLERMVGRSTEA